ncbi:MAG TPA: electron transfer flavoprotein subunit alpha/FixB family protein, partial [Terricaulis sp.]|nr:electron transfer flavoprotein subunit alpha/FixB family protein [Terricaulis sp.]
MAVLVIAEHDDATLKDSTNKVVTAAKAIGADVDVLVAGHNAGAVAAEAAKIEGVRKVLHADGASLAKQMAEPLEALIVPLAANYDAILFPATTTGKNAAPRVAAKLDVMQLSGVIGVEGADTFVRPIYAGNAIITVKDEQAKKVLTVQPTAFK